jgi:demethylmenaquinone methyltransferase/2-methoxy-6-polyprenyl-1,4-benzoquinol methylase
MSESTKNLVPRFFDKTALTYDKIVNQTTFAKDKYWKKEILKKVPQCKSILDLACGTGILTEKISKNLPYAKIVGVDITESYLNIAKKRLASKENVSFVKQDAEKLDLKEKFDCITSSYIPKYCNPEILVAVCMKHLKDGGKIILHDFTYPEHKGVRILWNLYFVVLNIMGYFIPNWKDVFVELPKLIKSTRWLVEFEKVMKNNGLNVELQEMTWGCSAILTGSNIV